jgi:ankyrin repeat protein
MREENIPLLVELAINDDFEALEALSVLPFFKQLVNDETSEQGWTPVLAASAHPKSIEHRSLKFLVENGADLFHVKKLDGNTALHLACGNNQIHIIDFYLSRLSPSERKLHLSTKNKLGLTPAHFAASMENFDAMSLLLEHGADLTIESEPNNNVFAELIQHDFSDLLSCVWHLSKLVKRDLNQVSAFILI